MREAIEEAGVRGDLLVRFKGYASSSYLCDSYKI